MKIAAAVLDAMTVEQLNEARRMAQASTIALRRKNHDVAADWWAAVEAAIVGPWGIVTDVSAECIGLGSEVRYVAALLDELRDHQNRPDPERALWAELLAALDEHVSRPMARTDLGGLLAVLDGETPMAPEAGVWTATTAEALAEMAAEG